MKGLIHYNDICRLPLQDVVNLILQAEKLKYKDLTLGNLALKKLDQTRIWEYHNDPDVFGKGIYIMFDGDEPVYVGMVKKNFLHRFQSHRHFDGRKEWGYNKLARYIAKHKLNQEEWAYEKKLFNENVIPELEELHVMRLHAPMLNNTQIGKLEKVFLKTLGSPPYRIYNEVNILNTYDLQKSLYELIPGK